MRWLFVLTVLLTPPLTYAYISGIDDVNANITKEEQARLDDAITTYYEHPSKKKVETVLDIMNDTPLLRKKGSWPPIIGFLAVVFKDNKQYLFDWMGMHDYNLYAEDVFVSALMHDNLRETALVFAQAHHWRRADIDRIRYGYDAVDLKHLNIAVPGHIDTLWGAFFASGDAIYVNEIINVLFKKDPPTPPDAVPNEFSNLPLENKKLAENTLKQYAALHKKVRNIVKSRIAGEENAEVKSYLRRIILGQPS